MFFFNKRFFTITESVILLVNINYLLLEVVLSKLKALHDNTHRQVVTMIIGLSLTANCWLFMVTNIGKFFPSQV